VSLTQKEKVIQEKRTIEATKKNMMGITGKLGLIVRVLGSPVVRQASGLYDQYFLDDPYENESNTERSGMMSDQLGPEIWQDEIKDADDSCSQEEGYVFDGLSRGMHFEIKFWHYNQKLDVSYKGYQVYKEIGGELFAYAPFDEWEQMVERLYKVAKRQSSQLKDIKEFETRQTIESQKRSFWQKLKMKWGI
jgi:hypothetical protein